MSKIERACGPRDFSEAEIRSMVAETKRREAQPGYLEAEAQRRSAAEARGRAIGTRFPELARKSGSAAPDRESFQTMIDMLR